VVSLVFIFLGVVGLLGFIFLGVIFFGVVFLAWIFFGVVFFVVVSLLVFLLMVAFCGAEILEKVFFSTFCPFSFKKYLGG
jgi:hypothetical protein